MLPASSRQAMMPMDSDSAVPALEKPSALPLEGYDDLVNRLTRGNPMMLDFQRLNHQAFDMHVASPEYWLSR
jgi:hypothetical protein